MNEDFLKECHVPVTMIWGKKDYSHRYTNEQTLKEVVPHAKIIVWDDCGHFPELEHTDRFLEIIKS